MSEEDRLRDCIAYMERSHEIVVAELRAALEDVKAKLRKAYDDLARVDNMRIAEARSRS